MVLPGFGMLQWIREIGKFFVWNIQRLHVGIDHQDDEVSEFGNGFDKILLVVHGGNIIHRVKRPKRQRH